MLENRIENYVVRAIKKRGGLIIKMASPSMDSLPDRQIIMPGGKTYWRELKRPGKEPTKKQWYVIDLLNELGQDAAYIDTIEKAKEFIKSI